MRLGHYWERMRTLPPGEVVRRARNKIQERVQNILSRRQSYGKSTYCLQQPKWLSGKLTRHFPTAAAPLVIDPSVLTTCRLLSEHYLAHRFNLLGSGWREVRLPGSDTASAGLADRINASNLSEATRIQNLIRKEYVPIDWPVDFKSGHRWPSQKWCGDLDIGLTPGVDVKVPWELARMQHLAQFVWAYAASNSSPTQSAGFAPAETYRLEFRDQILDFIAQNPPGFGVNWVCTMDVGIRIANWILTRDLFLSHGAAFDSDFEAVFARSVYEHGRHIINHLEWSPGLRSNHYYADIAGLAVAAAALPTAPESDAWLAFAVRELLAETEIQFLPDGGNFEASTSYHRLSAEMAVYATAVVLGLPQARLTAILDAPPEHSLYLPRFFQYRTLPPHTYPGWGPLPFPHAYFERLERAAEFTMDITKPDGHIPQFGDNDSGRFLKLFPALRPGDNCQEEFLNHHHLVAALNGFFGRPDFETFAGNAKIEMALLNSLLGGRRVPSYHPVNSAVPLSQLARYPDFGLYIYRKPAFYLAFRCGSIGQLGNGGHAHNDQLAFELAIGGVSFLEDPGTYLYTPDWKNRNLFRSTSSHNTLAIAGLEQNPWENTRSGLFSLISRSRAETTEIGEFHASGSHLGFGTPHKRLLELGQGSLVGTDWCDQAGAKSLAFHFAPEVEVALTPGGKSLEANCNGIGMSLRSDVGTWSLDAGVSSPAYGEIRKTRVATLHLAEETQAKWYIEWSG